MKAEQRHFQQGPFGEVEPIPYRARFSLDEFQRITECLTPGAMENKWFVYFREPSLCLHRRWTGKAIYRVDFDVNLDGAIVREVACASDVLAASDADYEARVLGFLIANLLAEAKCRTISAWRPAYSARSFVDSARA